MCSGDRPPSWPRLGGTLVYEVLKLTQGMLGTPGEAFLWGVTVPEVLDDVAAGTTAAVIGSVGRRGVPQHASVLIHAVALGHYALEPVGQSAGELVGVHGSSLSESGPDGAGEGAFSPGSLFPDAAMCRLDGAGSQRRSLVLAVSARTALFSLMREGVTGKRAELEPGS